MERSENPEERTVVVKSVTITGVPEGAASRALLLVLAGPAIGQAYTVGPQPAVLGRAEGNEVVIPDPGISRQHARIALTADGFAIDDLGSSNGTFVDGSRIGERVPLREANRIQLGPDTVMKFAQLDPLEAAVQQRLQEAIHRDVLTGVHNRRYLATRLQEEFAYATRHRRTLCLLMLDIDHFKEINDTHGHPVGDEVLRALAADLAGQVRTEDVVVRYGGEEFLIVARDLAADQLLEFAERLRSGVHARPVRLADGRQLPITVSVGLACIRLGLDDNPEAMIGRADAALYQAKQRGRNRIEFAA